MPTTSTAQTHASTSPARTLARIALALVLVFGLAFVPLSAFAANAAAETGASTSTAATLDESAAYVEGEVIIVYEDEALELDDALVSSTSDAETLADAGVTSQEEIASAADEGTVVLAELDEGVSVADAISELEASESIACVQPNYTYELMSTTSDPYLIDDATADYNQYYLFASGFIDAWDSATVSGSVTVAVLDTGCSLTHEDLADTVNAALAYDVTTSTLLSASDVDNDGDADGHGTMVCGIVAATADNALGIAGASYNANVLPVKIFDDEGTCTTADVVAAYDYLDALIDAGTLTDLRVVNLSVGVYSTGETSGDVAMETAIESMLDEHDVLTVCAGGNGDGETAYTAACYPADFDACVSVTALDTDGANALFSDYNAAKDISAYGVDILTTTASGAYATTSGTSAAAPQVAAAIALLYAANPALTSEQVLDILYGTATEVTGNAHAESGSAGALSVAAAVAEALATEGEATDAEDADADEEATDEESSTADDAQDDDATDADAAADEDTDDETLILLADEESDDADADGAAALAQTGDSAATVLFAALVVSALATFVLTASLHRRRV